MIEQEKSVYTMEIFHGMDLNFFGRHLAEQKPFHKSMQCDFCESIQLISTCSPNISVLLLRYSAWHLNLLTNKPKNRH